MSVSEPLPACTARHAPAGEEAGSVDVSHDMTSIMVMDATLPLAEIKAHLSKIVDGVEGRHERVTLTRNGRPAAVLISPEDLEALEDTLELLSDPRFLAEIKKARGEIARGKGVKAEELRARYLGT